MSEVSHALSAHRSSLVKVPKSAIGDPNKEIHSDRAERSRMTNDSEEELVCPECGGLTQVLRERLTLGLSCTRCTWSVVSTCIPEIQLDYTSYEVRVGGGDYRNR